jgi:small subunit ribosomal protein S20
MSTRKAIDSRTVFDYLEAEKINPRSSFTQEIEMATHPSAEKRARTARRRAIRNISAKSKMKTAVKRVRNAKDKAQAMSDLRKTVKLLDQLAAKGVIHKNNAANQKSKLTRLVGAMK